MTGLRTTPARLALTRMALPCMALAVASVVALAGCGSDGRTFDQVDAPADALADFDYVIPPGAGRALDAGAPLDLLPERFEASVGQTIQIVNEDDRGHLIGPWFVGAGETLRQTFKSPGEFVGECTVAHGGEITVVISA